MRTDTTKITVTYLPTVQSLCSLLKQFHRPRTIYKELKHLFSLLFFLSHDSVALVNDFSVIIPMHRPTDPPIIYLGTLLAKSIKLYKKGTEINKKSKNQWPQKQQENEHPRHPLICHLETRTTISHNTEVLSLPAPSKYPSTAFFLVMGTNKCFEPGMCF